MQKNASEQELLRVPANSPQGNGWFYVTNMAVAYEVEGKGIYLNFIPHDAIKEFRPIGAGVFGAKKFRVAWQEPGGEFFFEFRTKHHKQLEKILSGFHYSDSQSSKSAMRIPDYVSGGERWNDCWYDKKRELYVTYNKRLETIERVRGRPEQIQYEKETGDKGIVAIEEKIFFKYGYPCVKVTYNDGSYQNILLPTMTDEMLTDEIVKNRLKPMTKEGSVYYEAESERWIKVLGTVICEREAEIAQRLGIIFEMAMQDVKALHGRP